MFFHEFREHLVLTSELIFQEGDPPVLAVGGSSRAGLECGSGVLEELLLPAVEHRGANAVLVTEIRDRGAFQQVKSKNGDLFLGSEAIPGFLGHGETSARNCTLFERAFYPISTEARQALVPWQGPPWERALPILTKPPLWRQGNLPHTADLDAAEVALQYKRLWMV